jgi:hypothetical protein
MTKDEWVKISIVVAAYAAWICFAVIVEQRRPVDRSHGGPFCQYPTPPDVDYPECQFKHRNA